MVFDSQEKYALITAGSAGIGLALVRPLLRNRAKESGKGDDDAGALQYSSTSFNRGDLRVPARVVPPCLTGCDTNSALFWHGKNKLWSAIQKYPQLLTKAEAFLQPTSIYQAIADAGVKCLIALYGGINSNKAELKIKIDESEDFR